MAVSKDYLQYVLEQLSDLNHVTSRRMFGGAGLYCDGVFFGLIDNDALYFKVDDSSRPRYEARGMNRFRPYPDKPELSLTYYEVPAEALDDREELIAWAREAVAVALASKDNGGRRTRAANHRMRSRKKS